MDNDIPAAPAEPPIEPPRYLPALPQRLFTRRRFITVLGGSGIGGYLWHADLADAGVLTQRLSRFRNRVLTDIHHVAERVQANPFVGTQRPTRTLVFNLARREDMLRLRIELFNVVEANNNPNQLVKKASSQPAYAVVNFPPQHLAEEALLRLDGQNKFPDDPKPKSLDGGGDEHFAINALARARLAGESRLVFEIPASSFPLPRTQAALLNWLPWTARLAPGARVPSGNTGPAPAAPVATSSNEPGETALEIPWRLILSPLGRAAWQHNRNATPSPAGVYELWHTRLAAQLTLTTQNGTKTTIVDERLNRSVRAIWNTDPVFTAKKDAPDNDAYDDDDTYATVGKQPIGDGDKLNGPWAPFRTSLSPRNRIQIVQNSAGFNRPLGQVKPIDVNRMMLSSLGATVDLVGKWSDPKSLDLILWRHRAALGRDSFVETIERGFFMPWGFEAVRIKITKRKIENRDYAPAANGKLNVAYLEQRIHYVILDPVIDYPQSGHEFDARALPFRQIRAKTVVTPSLEDDIEMIPPGIVPSHGGQNSQENAFRFDLEATDWAGNSVAIRQPMAFYYFSKIADPTAHVGSLKAGSISVDWDLLPETHVLKRTPINGQMVAFAAPDKRGDTTFETDYITTSIPIRSNALGKNQAWLVPVMHRAKVRVEAAEALSGDDVKGVEVEYPRHYVEKNFNGTDNKPSTFLRIVSDTTVNFGRTDQAGGVAAPSLKLTALSRARGAIGGNEATQLLGNFDPSEWFTLPDANLVGVKLADVIATSVNDLNKSMTMKTVETAAGREVQLAWAPNLKSDPAKILLPSRAGKAGSFKLNASILRKPDGTVTSDIRGDLQNVTLQLLGKDLHFLDIEIQRLIFTQKDQTSPHLDVRLGDIKFAGPLQFVNELRKVLQNQSGPVHVDVSPAGIVARASVSVPSIGVGIFSLTNLALSAEVGVPFSPAPTYANFAISSKQDPFHVAVSIFGGGGWFALGINTKGLQSIEAGFEFGGTVSVDFGVAGGSIEIMAGIYFKVETIPGKGDRVQLTGYMRFHGEVHVGFVSVGLTAELDFSYVSKTDSNGKHRNIVTGRCEVTLEIPVAPDVSFEIEKSFGGDPHDPRFVDQITQAEWLDYVDAFASEL